MNDNDKNQLDFFQGKMITETELSMITEPEMRIKDMRTATMQQNSLFPSGMNISEFFLPKLKPEPMTETDLTVTLQALTHYSLMPQNGDNRRFYDDIINYLEIKKTLFQQDIPIVVAVLKEVNKKYLNNLIEVDKQLNADVELKAYYRAKMGEINNVLAKLLPWNLQEVK
jgi:hypothetical protein